MATSARAAAQAALQPLISRAHDHLSALAVRPICFAAVLLIALLARHCSSVRMGPTYIACMQHGVLMSIDSTGAAAATR